MPQNGTAAPRRRRALAELDARIEQAEQAHAQRRLDVENLADAAKSASRASRIVTLAEERLSLLRRSREALLADEPARHESRA